MLGRDPFEFGQAISELWRMEDICERVTGLDLQQVADTKGQVRMVLDDITRICAAAGLDNDLGPELRRFEYALANNPLEDIAQRCDHLRNRLLDELSRESYFHVRRDDIQFFNHPGAFGTAVARKFPKAVTDITNAGNCLALQEPTASVFHLMRAMEVAVRTLGKKLQVTIAPQATWGSLTTQMNDKIKQMPADTAALKKKRSRWEAASVNLHHVRSIWRNNTMHPAASYSQDEARDIFNAVRVFMKGLCGL